MRIFFAIVKNYTPQAKINADGKDVIVTGQHHVPIQSLAPATVLAKTPSSDVSNIYFTVNY